VEAAPHVPSHLRDRLARLPDDHGERRRERTQDEATSAMHGVLHMKSGLAAARAGDAATENGPR
jgi:hypothetical protein